MTRKRKDYRELKVSSFSGYGYKSAPMLTESLLTMELIQRSGVWFSRVPVMWLSSRILPSLLLILF